MIARETKIETVSYCIEGKWERPERRSLQPVMGAVSGNMPYATEADIDRAAQAAHETFLK